MKDETKGILGIAYLYTTIVIIFSVIAYLEAYLITGADNIDKHYTINILILFVIFAVLLIVLFTLNKKQGQCLGEAFQDNTARKTTGLLVLIGCAFSLSLLATAFKSVYTQITSNSDDGSVIPNILNFAIYLCQVFIAIWFLSYKGKKDQSINTDAVIGIAFLYTIISVSFYLLTRLTEPIIYHSSLKKYLLPWFITSILILIVLYILNMRRNQSITSIFQNSMIRKSSGVLIIIDGIIDISSKLNSLLGTLWAMDFLGESFNFKDKCVMYNVTRIIVFTLQIGFGIYMLKYYKGKDSTEYLT